jgi:hypothetical protein
MRQLKAAVSVLALCAAGGMLNGCGSGGSTYAPVVKQIGSYTVTIQNAPQERGANVRTISASQSVYYPNAAVYTVTVTGSGGFTGNVQLSVQGLPGTSLGSEFNNSSVSLSPSNTKATRTLTVTPLNLNLDLDTEYPFTVNGASGGIVEQSNSAGITVLEYYT